MSLSRPRVADAFKHLLLSIAMVLLNSSIAQAKNMEMPYIAKWYGNKVAAVSLRFDDASETHVQTAIPMLERYGFKATFMINPGRRLYQKHKYFWEQQVPAMGHRLGNHTWNHKGAENLEEAEYQIRSVSELIWKLYPSCSKLTVFASGGGEKWAGAYWESAPAEIKQLVAKYHLIDLYDGNHPSKMAKMDIEAEDLCKAVEEAIRTRSHQVFSFHRIGEPDIYDYARWILGRGIYTFGVEGFQRFLSCLKEVEDRVWISPMVQVYKYEFEYKSAALKMVENKKEEMKLKLSIASDSVLYDQPLTLVIKSGAAGLNVTQSINGADKNLPVESSSDTFLVDIEPVNSEITIIVSGLPSGEGSVEQRRE